MWVKCVHTFIFQLEIWCTIHFLFFFLLKERRNLEWDWKKEIDNPQESQTIYLFSFVFCVAFCINRCHAREPCNLLLVISVDSSYYFFLLVLRCGEEEMLRFIKHVLFKDPSMDWFYRNCPRFLFFSRTFHSFPLLKKFIFLSHYSLLFLCIPYMQW